MKKGWFKLAGKSKKVFNVSDNRKVNSQKINISRRTGAKVELLPESLKTLIFSIKPNNLGVIFRIEPNNLGVIFRFR